MPIKRKLTLQQEAQSGRAFNLISPEAQALRRGLGQISLENASTRQIGGNMNTPSVTFNNPEASGLGPQDQQTYGLLKQYLQKLVDRGLTINPNIQLTPDKIAEFMVQATNEIDPFYAQQLKAAKDQLLSGFGYSRNQILAQEQQVQQQYGRQLQDIGESSAEQGLAQSGRRQLAEQQLALGTQAQLDEARKRLGYDTQAAASGFAGQFGTTNLPNFNISGSPTVVAGQSQFQTSPERALYQLSPEVYGGLTGVQQFQERADIRNRASQLGSTYLQDQYNQQLRKLTQ